MQTHRVECAVKIHLDFDAGQWRPSHVNIDGEALDLSGDIVIEPHDCADPDECADVHDTAIRTPLPSGQHLMVQLAELIADQAHTATSPTR